MRVGTISEWRPLDSSSELLRFEITRSVSFPEVSADSVIILGCHLECLESKFASQRLSDIPLTVPPSAQEAIVIGGIGKDGDPLVILGRSAKKGDTSNVNLFDRVCESASRFRDGLGEWIEVADHDRDGGNRLGFEILFVGRDRTGENA